MEIKGKTVAVTGAARGIGRALSEQLAACGANLALIDLEAAALQHTCAACLGLGVQARAYGASVAIESQLIDTFDRIVAECRVQWDDPCEHRQESRLGDSRDRASG